MWSSPVLLSLFVGVFKEAVAQARRVWGQKPSPPGQAEALGTFKAKQHAGPNQECSNSHSRAVPMTMSSMQKGTRGEVSLH